MPYKNVTPSSGEKISIDKGKLQNIDSHRKLGGLSKIHHRDQTRAKTGPEPFVASLGFNGKHYETTLEMMLCVPERRLAWRTLADQRAPDHLAAGVVSFASVSDQSTCLTLKLTSSFGGAVSNRIDKYFHNFKRLIEAS